MDDLQPAAYYLNLLPDVTPAERYDDETGDLPSPADNADVDSTAIDILHSSDEEGSTKPKAHHDAPGTWSPSGTGAAVAVIDEAFWSLSSALPHGASVQLVVDIMTACVLYHLSAQPPRLAGRGRLIHITDQPVGDFASFLEEGYDTSRHAVHIVLGWITDTDARNLLYESFSVNPGTCLLVDLSPTSHTPEFERLVNLLAPLLSNAFIRGAMSS